MTGARLAVITGSIALALVAVVLLAVGLASGDNSAVYYYSSIVASVLAGFALFDTIRELSARGHKMTIQVMGYAMSMAVAVLQAADERVMSPNSFLLIHEISHESENMSLSQHKDNVKHSTMMQNKMFGLLEARSSMTARKLKAKAARTDWLIDSKEALSVGLVDRIS